MTLMDRMLIIGGNSSLAPGLIEAASKLSLKIDITVSNLDLIAPETRKDMNVLELNLEKNESCDKFSNSLQNSSYKYIVFLAGITSGKAIEVARYTDIQKVFQINVIGFLSILPKLQQSLSKDGRICLVGSVSAEGSSYDVVYGASKAALSIAASSFAKRMPETQAIFTIQPTAIENSKMFDEMSKETQEKHRDRAKGKLLQISDVSRTIIDLLTSSKPTNGTFAVKMENYS